MSPLPLLLCSTPLVFACLSPAPPRHTFPFCLPLLVFSFTYSCTRHPNASTSSVVNALCTQEETEKKQRLSEENNASIAAERASLKVRGRGGEASLPGRHSKLHFFRPLASRSVPLPPTSSRLSTRLRYFHLPPNESPPFLSSVPRARAGARKAAAVGDAEGHGSRQAQDRSGAEGEPPPPYRPSSFLTLPTLLFFLPSCFPAFPAFVEGMARRLPPPPRHPFRDASPSRPRLPSPLPA